MTQSTAPGKVMSVAKNTMSSPWIREKKRYGRKGTQRAVDLAFGRERRVKDAVELWQTKIGLAQQVYTPEHTVMLMTQVQCKDMYEKYMTAPNIANRTYTSKDICKMIANAQQVIHSQFLCKNLWFGSLVLLDEHTRVLVILALFHGNF